MPNLIIIFSATKGRRDIKIELIEYAEFSVDIHFFRFCLEISFLDKLRLNN